jgi:hypothetical protein
MLTVSPRLAAVSGALALGLFGLPSQGCKRQAPTPAPVPSAVPPLPASALPSAEEMTHCRPRPGFALTLDAPAAAEKAAAAPADGEDEVDDDALMPFGVDIGAAVATPFGFAAAGIRGAGQAFVALLGARASRRIELGELHGDAETPALAALGEQVLVAQRTTDAAGFTIKLGRITGPESSVVEWGHELTKLGKSVTGVELAAQGTRGVLVYQGEVKGDARLLLGSFAADKLAEPFEVKPLEAKDVEMPRLLARPGGYWLSWVRTLPEPKKAAKAGADAGAGQDPEERELLDVGLRVVEVLKLDEQGKAAGSALRVGEPRRQVLLYDVATLANGGLLVAARSDSAAPGAEGGAILLSEIGTDGSVREERLDDDEIGAGAPTLLMDSDRAQPGPWLAVSAPNDVTRLGLARGAHSALQTDPLLGRAEIIAVSGGHFLAQRARGRSVSLEALDCAWPAAGAPEKK